MSSKVSLLSEKFSTRLMFVSVAAWKIIDTIVSLIVPQFIPYLGFFSYGPTMLQYGMPDFMRALTNFDGIFYIRIATRGYQLTEQAYFPLYPILLRVFNSVVQNPIISGLLVSLMAFLVGIFLFKKYLGSVANAQSIPWILFFLLVYPTSYYLGVLYTESLFFLLLVGTLYSLKQKRYLVSMVLAFCVSLTRVVGILIILPIITTFIQELVKSCPKKFQQWISLSVKNWRIVGVGISAMLGLATYSFYLWKTLGDPLYFIHAQESFGAQRSSSIVTPPHVLFRYVKIFLTADWNFQYLVAVMEFVFYTSAIALIFVEFLNLWKKFKKVKRIDFDRLGLAAFSLANILVPSLTGTLTAMPRYTLMSLSIFLVLGEIKSPKIKFAAMAISASLHIAYFALFVQGYYVT